MKGKVKEMENVNVTENRKELKTNDVLEMVKANKTMRAREAKAKAYIRRCKRRETMEFIGDLLGTICIFASFALAYIVLYAYGF